MSLPPLRAATNDDEPELLELLRVAHAEAPYGRMSERKVKATVNECLSLGVVIVSLSKSQIVGSVGLAPTTFWWSDDTILQDRWTFVHPQHRRAPHARALLGTAKQTAKAAGMPLMIGVTSSIRTAGKVRVFMREFGEPIGATFLVGG